MSKWFVRDLCRSRWDEFQTPSTVALVETSANYHFRAPKLRGVFVGVLNERLKACIIASKHTGAQSPDGCTDPWRIPSQRVSGPIQPMSHRLVRTSEENRRSSLAMRVGRFSVDVKR